MKGPIVGFVSGLVFGLGLLVSGMANPAKVIAFLDVTGNWDPSLMFVMGGAMLTTLVGYRWAWRHSRPYFAERFDLPTKSRIDARLIFGAALFGVGWGLGGFCPGPAWVALAWGQLGTVVFFVTFLGGLALARR